MNGGGGRREGKKEVDPRGRRQREGSNTKNVTEQVLGVI
jgi:hypothetical protein